jgi:hypothetical protein
MNTSFQRRQGQPQGRGIRRPSRATWPRRVASFGLLAAVGALAAHHLLLFAQRVLDRSLLDPAVALRWSLSFLLVAGLVALARRGVRLGNPRTAGTVTLLVLLLHLGLAGPASQPTTAEAPPFAAPVGLLAVVPVAVVLVGAAELVARLCAGTAATFRAVSRRPSRELLTPPRRVRWARSAWAARPPPPLLA